MLAFAFAIARKLYFNIFLKLLPYVVTAFPNYFCKRKGYYFIYYIILLRQSGVP